MSTSRALRLAPAIAVIVLLVWPELLRADEPSDVLRDVWTRIQQIAPGQDPSPNRPHPQAVQTSADAPSIPLRDLSHPISLERSIRAAPMGKVSNRLHHVFRFQGIDQYVGAEFLCACQPFFAGVQRDHSGAHV